MHYLALIALLTQWQSFDQHLCGGMETPPFSNFIDFVVSLAQNQFERGTTVRSEMILQNTYLFSWSVPRLSYAICKKYTHDVARSSFCYVSISSLSLGAPFRYIFLISVALSLSLLQYYDPYTILPQEEVTRGR